MEDETVAPLSVILVILKLKTLQKKHSHRPDGRIRYADDILHAGGKMLMAAREFALNSEGGCCSLPCVIGPSVLSFCCTSKRLIATAQGFLAGTGNEQECEILFFK